MSWSTQTIDSTDGFAPNAPSSIALDENNYPHIAYCNETQFALKYAKWTGKTWETSVIGPAIGRGAVSLALDGKGDSHIVYYSGDGELMWIHKGRNQ